MRNKIIVAALCILMISAMLPVTIAVNPQGDNTDGCHKKLFSKTCIKGFIIGPKTEGRTLTFFAIFVQYATSSLLGETERGVLILQKVSFTGRFFGELSKFYISGVIYSILA
ncbi:MAG: hypothetical protein QXS02_06190 [Candidatus Thermoplasmatota archaeon]